MIQINKKLITILLVASLLLGAGAAVILASYGVGGTALLSNAQYSEYKNYMQRYNKLNTILEYIEKNYYTDIEEEKLLDGAYSGLVAGLGDEYSSYMDADELDDITKRLSGKFYGVGVTFTMTDEGIVEVVSTVPGSPADQAGVKPKDIMLAVNGESIEGLSTSLIRELIRGEDGTAVELSFKRGDIEYTATMIRQEISDTSVGHSIIDVDENTKLGYIYITSFIQNTCDDFEKALKEVEAEDVKGLIVDLRYNGGGLVDVACQTADLLMDKGTIAYALAKDGGKEIYTTQDGRTPLDYVVLVDEGTASASEIMTIGIKENHEGLIVGTRTYGKGIIQITQTMPDGSAIKLTYLEYFSPSGEKIHGIGITPDYEVELPLLPEPGEIYVTDTQLDKAIELLLDRNN